MAKTINDRINIACRQSVMNSSSLNKPFSDNIQELEKLSTKLVNPRLDTKQVLKLSAKIESLLQEIEGWSMTSHCDVSYITGKTMDELELLLLSI